MDNNKIQDQGLQVAGALYQGESAAFRGGTRPRGGCPRGSEAPLGIYAKLQAATSDNLAFDEKTGEVIKLKHSANGLVKDVSESDIISASRSERYKLLDISANVLLSFHGSEVPKNQHGHEKHHRTCKCNRVRHAPTAQVLKSKDYDRHFYGGLVQCASAWTCPVCAPKLNERKANEMRLAFNQSEALGLNPYLFTFTAPHTSGDTIGNLVPQIKDALKRFWERRQVKKWKKSVGMVGNVRSFEIRYGDNGWHPHFHLIIFAKGAIDTTVKSSRGQTLPVDSQSDMYRSLLSEWQSACSLAGLDMPNHYGLDVQDGSKAGEYICKFGSEGDVLKTSSGDSVTWDMADEVTKGNVKKGKNNSLSPWDILRHCDSDDIDQAKRYRGLFLAYARSMKGLPQIKWSKGLRGQFVGLGKEMTDEEIIAEEESTSDLLCHITPKEWSWILKNDHRSVVLDLADNGGSKAVARFLFSSELYSGDFDVFYSRFINRNNDGDFSESCESKRTLPEGLTSKYMKGIDVEETNTVRSSEPVRSFLNDVVDWAARNLNNPVLPKKAPAEKVRLRKYKEVRDGS